MATIGEQDSGSTVGHSLHVAWKLHQSARSLSRTVIELDKAGRKILPLDAPPEYLSIGLADPTGQLVDAMDAYLSRETEEDDAAPLPPQALAESLDHLNSAWRNAFGAWLLLAPQMTAVTGLSMAVTSRADFESRLSYFAGVLKAMTIQDSLLSENGRKEFRTDATLARLRDALQLRLPPDEMGVATQALAVLSDTRKLRTALQHAHADDLPTAMARLGLPCGADWGTNWERLRKRLVASLSDLRRAVTSLVPQ